MARAAPCVPGNLEIKAAPVSERRVHKFTAPRDRTFMPGALSGGTSPACRETLQGGSTSDDSVI